MKNVTITLPDALARRARVEAARSGKSLSRWIGEKLAAEIGRDQGQIAGLNALLALPLAPLSKRGKLPSRAEYYDRESVRRFQRDPLRPGSGGTRKKKKVD